MCLSQGSSYESHTGGLDSRKFSLILSFTVVHADDSFCSWHSCFSCSASASLGVVARRAGRARGGRAALLASGPTSWPSECGMPTLPGPVRLGEGRPGRGL